MTQQLVEVCLDRLSCRGGTGRTATRVCNPDALEALPENDVWKGDGGGAITSFPIVTTNAALKCGAVPPPYPGRFDDARNSMTGCAACPTIR